MDNKQTNKKGDKMRKMIMVIGIFGLLTSAASAGTWQTVPNVYGGWDTSYCSYCYNLGSLNMFD